MKRNELTTISKLQLGDRFFKVSDKKKCVYEVVESEAKATAYQTYKHFCCEAAIMDNARLTDKLKARQFKAVKGTTEVIFLRNKN